MKIQVNEEVVAILSEIIKNRRGDLFQITSGASDKEKFDSQIFPSEDVTKGEFSSKNTPVFLNLSVQDNRLLERAKEIIGADEVSNYLIYRPNTHMRWHTNSDIEGTRIYYTFTLGNAIFRYRKGNEIIDDVDDYKWTARSFRISKADPLWHTIWTDSVRFSFGFIKHDTDTEQ